MIHSLFTPQGKQRALTQATRAERARRMLTMILLTRSMGEKTMRSHTHGDRPESRRTMMSAHEVDGSPVHDGGLAPSGAEQTVSRRRLMQDSAVAAGAMALASRIDLRDAIAQDAAGTPSPQPPASR